jgi:hypothetical protein
LDWAINVDRQGEERADYLMGIGYSIHFHVWEPHTFLEFLNAAKAVARIDLEIVDEDSGDDEFLFIARRGRTLGDALRSKLPMSNRLLAAARELRSQVVFLRHQLLQTRSQ